MARNQHVEDCLNGEWTEITNDNVASVIFQANRGTVFIRYTANTTPPNLELEGVRYAPGEGERDTLENLTALAGAARVWARPADGEDAQVYVDHA